MSAGKVRYKEVAATIVVMTITLFLLVSATGFAQTQDDNLIVSFTAEQTSGPAPLTVQFHDTSPDDNMYQWDFGDGATSNEKDPSHTYQYDGIHDYFDVSLVISNSSNSTNALEKIQFIHIIVATPTPTATAVPSPSPSPSPTPTNNPGTGGGSTGSGGSNDYGINGSGPETTTTPTPTADINTSAGNVGGNPSVSPPPQDTTPPESTIAASGSQVTSRSPFSISNPTLIILALLSAIVIAVLLMYFISGKGQGGPKKKDEELTSDYLYKMVMGEDSSTAQKPEQQRIPINNYKKKKQG